jgi:hypothetical protein
MVRLTMPNANPKDFNQARLPTNNAARISKISASRLASNRGLSCGFCQSEELGPRISSLLGKVNGTGLLQQLDGMRSLGKHK